MTMAQAKCPGWHVTTNSPCSLCGWTASPDPKDAEIAALRARCEAAEAEVDRLSAWPQPQAEEIARLRACVDLNQRGHVHQIEQAVESQNRALAAEARIRMLLDVLETVTECEEHRPCGLCRERIRRAVEVKP